MIFAKYQKRCPFVLRGYQKMAADALLGKGTRKWLWDNSFTLWQLENYRE